MKLKRKFSIIKAEEQFKSFSPNNVLQKTKYVFDEKNKKIIEVDRYEIEKKIRILHVKFYNTEDEFCEIKFPLEYGNQTKVEFGQYSIPALYEDEESLIKDLFETTARDRELLENYKRSYDNKLKKIKEVLDISAVMAEKCPEYYL